MSETTDATARDSVRNGSASASSRDIFVVVDVGGTKVLAAVADSEGRILSRRKERTERKSKSKLIDQVSGAIEVALRDAGVKKSDMRGLALGVPGIVETNSGFVVLTPNAPLTKTPLGDMMRERWGAPVIIGNDANLGVVGEAWKGAGRGAQSAFGIFVGTGIGGGLVLNGQLIEGFRGLGGEIGHLMIPLGADEIAGMLEKKHLFLEDLCSRTAIENQLRHAIVNEGKKSALVDIVGDKKLERIRSGALKEALKQGDPLVEDVMRRASYLLGLATASVLHVVDPEVIIFGGGVVEACGKWMLPLIEKTARKVAMPGTGRELQIVQSTLGDDAILLGGVALLREKLKTMPASTSSTSPPPAASGETNFSTGVPQEKRSWAQVDKPLEG
jgi:glucokinase